MKKHIKITSASCLDAIDAINQRIMELDPTQIQSSEDITATEISDMQYVQGNLDINDEYLNELMQIISDESASFEDPKVCTYNINDESIDFILSGINNDSVVEYNCPITDLTGNLDTDIDYILDSIKEVNI